MNPLARRGSHRIGSTDSCILITVICHEKGTHPLGWVFFRRNGRDLNDQMQCSGGALLAGQGPGDTFRSFHHGSFGNKSVSRKTNLSDLKCTVPIGTIILHYRSRSCFHYVSKETFCFQIHSVTYFMCAYSGIASGICCVEDLAKSQI